MKKDASEKKTRQGLSLSPELLAAAKAKGGGNLSAYIRGLIERDLACTRDADALSKDVLTSLCRQLRPELLEDFEAAIAKVEISEARLLAELIHLGVSFQWLAAAKLAAT